MEPEHVQVSSDVDPTVGDLVGNVVNFASADHDSIVVLEDTNWFGYSLSIVIHLLLIGLVLCLKWRYDRNRYSYPKGPRKATARRADLRCLSDDLPDVCSTKKSGYHWVSLNTIESINEIFHERIDLLIEPIDKVFNYHKHRDKSKDHLQIIRTSLEHFFTKTVHEIKLDRCVQHHLNKTILSDNFNVEQTMFTLSTRLLIDFVCASARETIDIEQFTESLYKICKTIRRESIESVDKNLHKKFSCVFDEYSRVLNKVKSWITDRRDENATQIESASGKRKDFLDSMLSVINGRTVRLNDDDDDLAICLLRLMVKGSELIASSLSSILISAVKYPMEAEISRSEILDQEFNEFHFNRSAKLLHFQAFVKESLRLHPIDVEEIQMSTEDIRWRQYHLQRGTHFSANILALHFSALWKNPNEFDLKRWSVENRSGIVEQIYVPFGFEPRLCIDENYLFDLVTGIAAVLLYHNRFEASNDLSNLKCQSFQFDNVRLGAKPISSR